jgi:DNA-directed RNA polymerase subunit H (RpoH/RPB5)
MASQNATSGIGAGIITLIYKSRKNLLNLLERQGYNVSDYSNFTVTEVNAMYQNKQLDMLLEKTTEDPKTKRKSKIYIRYYLAKNLRPQNIQEMIDDLFQLEEVLTKDDTLLIISKDEMNDTLTNLIKHIWETDKLFIIIQNIKRLQYVILDNILVPKHRIMAEDEAMKIKEKYNCSDSDLPEISRFDPVAQAICIRPGQICEIIRPSKTAITSYYYRICV